MMDKDTLRRSDLFSGALILLLGLFVISQAVQMPMKDSWGGVQNVWFVSPALFPLFVGTMLAFLGTVLIIIGYKSVGLQGLQEALSFLRINTLTGFLRQPRSVRFFGIAVNLLIFVFLLVPRVDFFLAALMFLLIFFFMFYFGDHTHMVRITRYNLVFCALLVIFFISNLQESMAAISEYIADWLVLLFIPTLCFTAWKTVQMNPELKSRFRLCLILAILAPLTIGIIFKYFLLVPLPCEGLIVQLLDGIWYADLWS